MLFSHAIGHSLLPPLLPLISVIKTQSITNFSHDQAIYNINPAAMAKCYNIDAKKEEQHICNCKSDRAGDHSVVSPTPRHATSLTLHVTPKHITGPPQRQPARQHPKVNPIGVNVTKLGH